jgi:hypothetical protein
MLLTSLIRFYRGHFQPTSTLGFTLSGWYWHFVDVVWILVFTWIYLWGTWRNNIIISFFIINMFPDVIIDNEGFTSIFLDWVKRELY